MDAIRLASVPAVQRWCSACLFAMAFLGAIWYTESVKAIEQRRGDIIMDQEKRQSIARAERAASTVLRNHGVHGTPINAVKLAEALGYDVYQATSRTAPSVVASTFRRKVAGFT
jgi:hypothetical protein